MHPFYAIRLLGGLCFLTGALLMAFNMWRTLRSRPLAVGYDGRPVFAA
jgi:cytochrome c oxidase cbb3-type subunit 1